ncbi:MAG: helix-turn-helix transcriptional regulator [Deltaproteobacteria bacterium]|nr:helix-turn-helix transcriptional regulator [Deltaproteobacteria bacterium]
MARSALEQSFGAQVRRLRRMRALTQEVLAERSDLSVDSVRRIERGAFSPSLDTVDKLCRGLEVSLGTLFAAFERKRSTELDELCDLLAARSPRELRKAGRILRALFAENDPVHRSSARNSANRGGR